LNAPRIAPGPSLRLIAPLVLMLPVLVVVGVVGWIGVSQSRRDAREVANRVSEQVAVRVGERVAQHVRLAMRVSEQNAHLVAAGPYRPDELRSWLGTMRAQLDAFPSLSGVAWGDERGHAAWLVRYPGATSVEFAVLDDATGGLVEQFDLAPDESPRDEPDRRLPYDPRERPWYRVGAAALGVPTPAAWSDVYSWARADGTGATLGISYARAIAAEDGSLVGVLDTEIELGSLSAFMATLDLGKSGVAFIIDAGADDGAGRLIASSIGAPLVDTQGERVAARDAADPRMRSAARTGEEGGWSGRRAVASPVGTLWVARAPLAREMGLPWTLYVVTPEDDLIAPVRASQRRTLLMALGAVAITLTLGIVVARLAIRPVLRLRDHVRRVGAGEHERRIELRSVRELGELARDINAMASDLLEGARMRDSLRLAMDVQQALLPAACPRTPGLDIAARCVYCDETGGDYYDFLALEESEGAGGVSIAIGDVMGHGVAAALLMATARAVLRSGEGHGVTLPEHLARVNEQLVRDTGGRRFMTMLLMRIVPPCSSEACASGGSLAWSTAGQPAGLLYRPDDERASMLPGDGFPLGVVEGAAFDAQTLDGIPPGSVLLVATDGLFEAESPSGEAFGWDRVRGSLERHAARSAAEIAEGVYEDLLAFCDGKRIGDDVSLVVARFVQG
jgi:sigma-B regulation protein RsbU (phosphoserine phosphatase)